MMCLLLKHIKYYQHFKGLLLRIDKLNIKLIEMGEGQRNEKMRIVNKCSMNLYQLFHRGIGTAVVRQVSLSMHHYYAAVIRVQKMAPWKWVLAHFPFGLMMSEQWIGSLIGGIELGEGIQIAIHIQIQIHLGTCLTLDTQK